MFYATIRHSMKSTDKNNSIVWFVKNNISSNYDILLKKSINHAMDEPNQNRVVAKRIRIDETTLQVEAAIF